MDHTRLPLQIIHHTCLYLANIRKMAPPERQTSDSASDNIKVRRGIASRQAIIMLC